ncbi:MAG: hypothetical protein RSH26_08600, partial [Clostridia bacterium]
MRITENDCVILWEPYVRAAVCRWAHYLDSDDRYQAGMMGLLYAIRTHECRMIPFKDYLDAGWQPAHGLFALSSGGWFGQGIGGSAQKWG